MPARNRDDHTGEHSYLMDAQGQWRLAKAYDLFGRSRPRALSRYRGGGGAATPPARMFMAWVVATASPTA
ncbi:hypothetical protein [Pseudomonas syringae]|uniref:hypothetical protein n=1 Tax=Pseudomonas syringae TaxID=317 RepID=UPI0009415221